MIEAEVIMMHTLEATSQVSMALIYIIKDTVLSNFQKILAVVHCLFY